MPPIERRQPRRFRFLHMPMGRLLERLRLRRPAPPVAPAPDPATLAALLLHSGPEKLRREGSRHR